MQPTPAQHTAIHTHDRGLIVVAGAGSGKTRVLVERFLALLDANPDWPLNALVAITFTRKAAGEMRDRVRKGLNDRLRAAEPGSQAAQRWAALLAAMDSARINTIHALCADLLRANAAEADLDPAFIVLDEADAALLRADVVEDLLAAVAVQPDHPALPLFAVYDEGQVRAALSQAAFSVTLPALPDDLLAAWRDGWDMLAHQTFSALKADTTFWLAADWQPAGQWPDPAQDKLATVWANCASPLHTLRTSDDGRACYAALEQLCAVIRLNVGGAANWGGKAGLEDAKAALRAVREKAQAVREIIGAPINAHDEQAARLLPAWHALITDTQAAYRAVKQAAGALDFDDLEARTLRLLTEHPSVAARYRGLEFRHLMIDEFQDTNDAQWGIARALVADWRDLFLVGDPKQSIYAFRGADVRVFERVRGEIVAAGGPQAEVTLAKSFRTHAPLVARFNQVFAALLTAPDPSDPLTAYRVGFGVPMQAHRLTPPDDETPPVSLLLIDATDKKARGVNTETLRGWEAAHLAQTIQTMVERGQPVYDPDYNREQGVTRPVDYGDFAMLFQSLTSVQLYENALRAADIPFITLGGRGYYGRQEVHDLLSLLTALHNPDDELALATALRSPLFSLSDEALYALRLTEKPLWDALAAPGALLPPAEAPAVAFAHDLLTRLHQTAGRVTIAQLLYDALDATGYLAALAGLPNGAQRRGNVEKLLHKAQYSGKVRLGAFQAYLRDLSEQEVREGDAALDVQGMVQIMSVHNSKGLEFPVVLLPDASWDGSGDTRRVLSLTNGLACKVYDENGETVKPFVYRQAEALEDASQDAERRRLLYVAATRAQDYLIVSGQTSADSKTGAPRATGWLGWLLETLLQDAPDQVRWQHFDAPPAAATRQSRPSSPAWDSAPVRDRQPLTSAPVTTPALLRQVTIQREAQARHLAATTLADLGSAQMAEEADERRTARDRFRRLVLYDAPGHIRPVQRRAQRAQARQVGDIVHEALRYWRFPSSGADAAAQAYNARLLALLRSTAWELGITDQDAADRAVWEAERLLLNFRRSPLYSEISGAAVVYRELPFIYEHEAFIVHGVIDVLFRRPDGAWVLVDYKTALLRGTPGGAVSEARLLTHARRYHLQVGLYAQAVARQLGGQPPETRIHYVRYGTVTIPAADWSAALAQGLAQGVRVVMG